jgi:hypothetical protein
MFPTEILDTLLIKTVLTRNLEVVLIAIIDIPPYTPHIVLPIGIEELHRPTLTLGWKATEQKQLRITKNKRLEGMTLCGYIRHTSKKLVRWLT